MPIPVNSRDGFDGVLVNPDVSLSSMKSQRPLNADRERPGTRTRIALEATRSSTERD
ncbi:hypothetical protein [Natrinema sp. SYSU A 869]|uniref:hypothetical protein n=1 Tax=Natrinema sp. SYSU A 869 TaxID=2871694 RepID=UPI001CA43AFB|nr:hypothetical protein [Natrinema sp. SYSU A 869]